ncbi:hypothetical protein MSPP1_002125 [Malassezia sp. CBS 17886]|nr:hypothetical protein MSPP1_002125 [Malassezia sp. CBS 17886]
MSWADPPSAAHAGTPSCREENKGVETLGARLAALAKLTEEHVPGEDGDNRASSDGRAPRGAWAAPVDCARLEKLGESPSPNQFSMDSWRSLLEESPSGSNTPAHQNVCLGTGPSSENASDVDHIADVPLPGLGQRADLFVHRSPLGYPSPHTHQSNARACTIDASHRWRRGGSARPVSFAPTPSDVYLHPLRPHSTSGMEVREVAPGAVGVAAREYSTSSDKRPCVLEREVDENDRTTWPSCSWYHGTSMSSNPVVVDYSAEPRIASPSSTTLDQDLETSSAKRPLAAPRLDMPLKSSSLPGVYVTAKNAERPEPRDNAGTALSTQSDDRVKIVTKPGHYALTVHVPGFTLDGITIATKGFNRRTLHIIANHWDSVGAVSLERRITFV